MAALKKIRMNKMLAQGGLCYYCGLPMWDAAVVELQPSGVNGKRLPKVLQCTAEHLQPRSEGGKDSHSNIVAACLFCNTRRHFKKSPRSPEEHRKHVQKQMAAGRWLAASFHGVLAGASHLTE